MSAWAFYFGPPEQTLFGWIHQGGGGPGASVGVLICSPWGREDISAHQGLRQWAIRLSDAGWPTMRFDHYGTGDSAGDPGEPGNLHRWIEGVHLAIDCLRRQTGVQHVCLLGLRLGALLALEAALVRDDVAGFIAVAPVIKGRTYVRELRAMQAARGRAADEAEGAGVFPSGGFVMNAQDADTLSSLDMAQPQGRLPAHILILDRDDMPPTRQWAAALQEGGAEVLARSMPGFAAMMVDPHLTQLPEDMIDVSLRWLGEKLAVEQLAGCRGGGAAQAGARVVQPTLGARPSAAGLRQGPPPRDHALFTSKEGHGVRETPILVPGGAFGIVAEPATQAARSGLAIVLLNAGATRHIGPSRLWVDLARRWAGQGHIVLRLDLAGLGDTPPRPGRPVHLTYPYEAMEDVAAAVSLLRSRYGARQVHGAGVCAGAYHVLKAAREGLGLDAISVINPLIFHGAEGLIVNEASPTLSPQKVNSAAASYKQALRSADKWLKFLRGDVKYKVLAQVLARRALMRLDRYRRDAARLLHWPLQDDVGTDLLRLAARGVAVEFVFSEDDPGIAMLREQGGRAVERLRKRKRLDVAVIHDADHVFTDLPARRALTQHLQCTIDRIAGQ